MTSILRRMRLILKVWLDKLLASADDPRQVFMVAYRRQRELLSKVQRAQENIVDAKRQLESKTAGAREKLPQLEEQARQALVGGREDIARFALQLRQVATEDLEELERQVSELEQEERALSLVEQRLRTQIEAFFARQEVLAARYTTAEAQVRISEAMGGVSEELAGLGVALERAEQTTENMQARVTAIERLVETGILDTPTNRSLGAAPRQLADAEASGEVEDRLAALKGELGVG